ncbi:MAG: hypothetical protein KBD76_15595 [Bacteriovorax sp.]|nr:hypothetical protein [Bacteriovorax sp.]
MPYISSQFSVHWNGHKIRDILPTDLLINTISIPVVGKVGKNILGFHG